MAKLGTQAVKYQCQALVASDPENKTPLMQHYQGLTKYNDKLKLALQLKLDKTGIFMTVT